MFLVIEENKNCQGDERMFPTSGQKKLVGQVNVEAPNGTVSWCDVIGVNPNGTFQEAHAFQFDDSGAGAAWLIFGGEWGLRFRPFENKNPWSLDDKNQWGEPFKVLDISGADIKFKERKP